MAGNLEGHQSLDPFEAAFPLLSIERELFNILEGKAFKGRSQIKTGGLSAP